MAGDWIKFEIGTSDKAEVWAIAQALAIDPDAVVGKLLRVWSWFDQHTEDGNAPTVTKMLLDRVVGVTNFCDSVISVGWMQQDTTSISLTNFDRHNGKTAKNRATTAKRVASFKANSKKSNGDANAQVTPTPLPKEEKRREDISNTNVLDSSCSEPKASKPSAPVDDSKIFISIPTNKFNTEGEERPITENKISEWAQTYQAVDVRQTLLRIRSWVVNNPNKRKTFGGIFKFIDTWLAKEQNNGGGHAANQPRSFSGGNAGSSGAIATVYEQGRAIQANG